MMIGLLSFQTIKQTVLSGIRNFAAQTAVAVLCSKIYKRIFLVAPASQAISPEKELFLKIEKKVENITQSENLSSVRTICTIATVLLGLAILQYRVNQDRSAKDHPTEA